MEYRQMKVGHSVAGHLHPLVFQADDLAKNATLLHRYETAIKFFSRSVSSMRQAMIGYARKIVLHYFFRPNQYRDAAHLVYRRGRRT
jgi:hypothetical protein